ncbi:hypothetical protein FJZ31_26440 [Candidatus Poribacteria bacterium]|nr:hypothetical protein [Candidatus Poribacteria bacterium]
MILVVVITHLETWAAFLDPLGSPATVTIYQALYITYAIAFGNHTRLRNHTWSQFRNGYN